MMKSLARYEGLSTAYEQPRERGWEAHFRLTVLPTYNYTCAVTGYRCVTVINISPQQHIAAQLASCGEGI